MPPRSKLEQKIAILRFIRKASWTGQEVPVSNIMRGTAISWNKLVPLLSQLLGSGLISNRTQKAGQIFRRFYSLKEDGREVLNDFERLYEKMDEKPITVQEY